MAISIDANNGDVTTVQGSSEQKNKKSVFVSVVGRTNAGKSSLVNLFVGEKVAIVTHKPQTTRSKITGIVTVEELQYVFFDTPGLHNVRTKLGERMTGYASRSLSDVDVVLALFSPEKELKPEELDFISKIGAKKIPAIAALNKCDLLSSEEIAAQRDRIADTGVFEKVFTISVLEENGTDELLRYIGEFAQNDVHYYDTDSFTDQPMTSFVCELLREKLLLSLDKEVPHGIAVCCEKFSRRQNGIIDINVDIVCEKKTHKGIIIGKGGKTLKAAATAARIDMEALFETKVNLQCFVKIREGWRDSNTQLKNFGYKEL